VTIATTILALRVTFFYWVWIY